MRPEDWALAKRLLADAAELAPAERERYILEECPDAALAGEIATLLATPAPLSAIVSAGALVPGTRLGNYVVDVRIGAGGMGEVYRARDTRLGRQVAIKILPQLFASGEDVARFEREARLLASVNHPNIAHVHGIEDAAGTPATVMELVDGPTLADRIAKGPLTLDETLPIAKQIAEALEAAHEQGIIHRDLKPANIKIRPDGTVKVLDFGLAKALVTEMPTTLAATRVNTTRPGLVLGTPAYMSPEQARGHSVDKRTDIWAFGCVLFEMLTGAPAFDGHSGADIVSAVLTRTPDWARLPRETPPALRRLLRRCLDKDVRRRLRDIGDARDELDPAVDDPAVPGAVPSRPALRLSWLAAAAMAALVAGFVAWLMTRAAAPAVARSVAFQIGPPDGSTWDRFPSTPNVAVSRDGESIAFAAPTPAGLRLFIRGLNAVAAREMPGTQDVTTPFWSPDGRKIAYCAGGKIKKIDVRGRPPEDIAAPCTGEGDWYAGEIAFANRDGVFAVSENGGAPRWLTSISAPSQVAHLFPHWLPDGRHVLFLVKSSDEQVRGIHVVPAGGGAPRRILPDETMGIPVRDAAGQLHVVFVRAGTLVEQRFDASTFEPIDEPTVLAGPIAIGLTLPRGAYAASATTLAYRTDASFAPTRLQWFDRSGRALEAIDTGNAFVLGVALSPDESTVSFGRYNRDTGNFSVWLADRARGTTRLLAAPPHSIELGAWSPDGRVIAAVSNASRTYLPVKLSSTGQESPIAVAAAQNLRVTDWSEDGKVILGVEQGVVWAMSPDGAAPPRRVTAGRFARLSPDGKWLAYTSNETSADEVYVAPFPDATTKTRVSTAGGYEPKWRGDGRELFYLNGTGDLTAVTIRTAPSLAIGAPVRLFRSQMRRDIDATYVATRDGQRFLLNMPNPVSVPLNVVVNWLDGRGATR
jgi:Tol biopolymer transport system component